MTTKLDYRFVLAVLLGLISSAAIAQGVRTWYGNELFMQELDRSIASFFADKVGSYLPSNDYAFSLDPMKNTNQDERMKIATQFLAVFGHGAPEMQELPNGYTLYGYSAALDGMTRVAIVTPKYETTVLAAAMTHFSCGHLGRADVHDAAVIKSHYKSKACNRPTVTIFFMDRVTVNSLLKKELLRWGSHPFIAICESNRKIGLLDYPANSPGRKKYASYLQHLPPCRVHYTVVTLNP